MAHESSTLWKICEELRLKLFDHAVECDCLKYSGLRVSCEFLWKLHDLLEEILNSL